MKVSKGIKKIVNRYPKVAQLGYSSLQKYWKLKANYSDYDYPVDTTKANVTKEQVIDYNKNRPYGPKKRICYAPFNNLHFLMDGSVSACSFNYDYILGNINDESVKEIWTGERAAHFRSMLANYNFEKCASCKNVLDAKSYSSFPPLKYDIHSSDDAQYPTQMSFETSNLCNYECIMCYEDFSSLIRKNRAKLPPVKSSYPADFTEQLKEFIPHLSIATFIGGEPLLIKSYFEIWEEIIKTNPNCTIHIQTNASYLPPRFLELLESGQFEMGVSIDSPDKETFEKIRINSNFDEVEANIETLAGYLKRGKIFMNFNFCPLTVNWHQIPDMVEYANSYNIPLKVVNVENPRHLALVHRDAAYLENVYQSLVLHFDDFQSNSIIANKNIQAFNDFIRNIKFLSETARVREKQLAKLYHYSFEDICHKLEQTIEQNQLFSNFDAPAKQALIKSIKENIFPKYKEEEILKRVIARIIYIFEINEHEEDSPSSKDLEKGLTQFKRMIGEFYLLEEENLVGKN